jgi:hypothetical protein
MSHIQFVDNSSFNTQNIHYEKIESPSKDVYGIKCYRVMVGEKPMIYQSPKLFTFDGIKIKAPFPPYITVANVDGVGDIDMTTFFDNVSQMQTHMQTHMTNINSSHLDFTSSIRNLRHHHIEEKYGFQKIYEKDTKEIRLKIRKDKYHSIKCDLMEHVNGETKFTNSNMREVIPKNSFIKCDMIPTVYFDSRYYGISWTIGGISVVSIDPSFSKKFLMNEDESDNSELPPAEVAK